MVPKMAALAMAAMLAVTLGAVDAAPLGPDAAPHRAIVDPVLVATLARQPDAVALVQIEAELTSSVLQVLDRLALEHHYFDRLSYATVVLDAAALQALAATPGVRKLWADEPLSLYLDRSAEEIGAVILWENYGITGNGSTIFVVDSGVDGRHPDTRFGQNLVQNVEPQRGPAGRLQQDWRENVVASDPDGHGTHVAGIAAGLGIGGLDGSEAGRYKGIAHGAKLVGYAAAQVNQTGNITFSTGDLIGAYQYALQNMDEYGIDIVTNSWGATGVWDPENPVNDWTFDLYRSGMVVVFAAGNSGASLDPSNGTLNKYCVMPWVLCVGAGNYLYQRAGFSSVGTDPEATGRPFDHPDLLAPGVTIVSARANTNPGPGPVGAVYGVKNGTSMAAPHAAAVAALLLDANPRLSPDQIYDVIVASARPSNAPQWEVGAGFLDAWSAYELALQQRGARESFLRGNVKYGGAASGDPDYAADPLSVGLGKGSTRPITGRDVPLSQFATDLIDTQQGLLFLVGGLLLVAVAFGPRRGFTGPKAPRKP